MRLLLSIVLAVNYLFAGLEGKSVYGENHMDKKVEKYSKHRENPKGNYSSSKKSVIKDTKKEISGLKKEVNKNKLNQTTLHTKKHVDSILKQSNKKLKTSNHTLGDLKKERQTTSLKRKKIKSTKFTKQKVSRAKAKKRAYRRR